MVQHGAERPAHVVHGFARTKEGVDDDFGKRNTTSVEVCVCDGGEEDLRGGGEEVWGCVGEEGREGIVGYAALVEGCEDGGGGCWCGEGGLDVLEGGWSACNVNTGFSFLERS